MKTTIATPAFAAILLPRFLRSFAVLLSLAALALGTPRVQATQITAFTDFGPGNTYGNFGQTIGGQFINGYKFTSAAAGQLSELDVGIGGSGTFDLNLYTDNSGALGTSIW